MVDKDAIVYQCPGEDYSISRAVHLGRLATYYPKCRDCPHRADTGTLSPRRVRRLQAIARRGTQAAVFREDSIAGVLYTDITPGLVRNLAVAWAARIMEESSQQDRHPPTVVLGGDGRGPVTELLAAACDGLRWAGADVLELSAVSAPMLTLALRESHAAGGLLIGNPLSSSQTVGLKFWDASGQRLSLQEGVGSRFQSAAKDPPIPNTDHLRAENDSRPLGPVTDLFAELPLHRTSRRYGNVSRLAIEDLYLVDLWPYFHALRPLRLLMDCRCAPTWRQLRRLTAATACELLPLVGSETVISPPMNCSGVAPKPRRSMRGIDSPGVRVSEKPAYMDDGLKSPPDPFARLARHVLSERADAGLWIDGDGETLCLIDETGRAMPHESLAPFLTSVTDETPPAADALHAFVRLVTALSQSDRSVSEVMALAPRPKRAC